MGIANPLTSPAHKIGGLFFNGRDAYVEVPDSESLDITGETSVFLWINKRRNIKDFDDVISKRGYDPYSGFSFYTYGTNGLGLWLGYDTGRATYGISGVIDFNEWLFLGFTVSNDRTVKLWKNAVEILTETLPEDYYGINNVNLKIPEKADELDGFVFHVRIYNRALSQSEIQLLYSNPDYPLTNGLVLWLPMNEHSGNTVYDLSPYGNHGTIYNAEWTVRAVEHPLHAV